VCDLFMMRFGVFRVCVGIESSLEQSSYARFSSKPSMAW
jgi:hypothetical protein